MADNDAKLLRTFIADEVKALAEERQGRFWPSNHHRITPLIKKAAGLLDPAERTAFYLHLMRVSGSIPAVGDKELPLLVDAYTQMLPFLDLPGILQMSRRHNLLFVFGFDDTGPLPSGAIATAADLKTRLKLLTQIGNYTSLAAQIDKKDKFAPFAGQAPRLLETLRHLEYRPERRYADDNYTGINLDFWGMVFIGLLNPETRTGLAGDMVEGGFRLPQRDHQLALLHRFITAVIPDVEAGETRFLELAAILTGTERARRDASEPVLLAKALELPFEDDEDWDIQIQIPLRGSDFYPYNTSSVVRLQIRPNPDWQWDLHARLAGRGTYSEGEKGVTQNDIALPPLGEGNLHAFPAWLKSLRDGKGLDFDIDAAEYRVGRKRAAIKPLARWLAE